MTEAQTQTEETFSFVEWNNSKVKLTRKGQRIAIKNGPYPEMELDYLMCRKIINFIQGTAQNED